MTFCSYKQCLDIAVVAGGLIVLCVTAVHCVILCENLKMFAEAPKHVCE